MLQTKKRSKDIYTETNWLFYSLWLLQNRKIIVKCKFKMLPLSSHIISKVYESFFHTITNSKKLNPSRTQWYYVAIIQYNRLQACSSWIPKKKKKWEIKAKKYICNKPFVFVSHQRSSCCTRNERWPANCCPKIQGKQWHLGPSTSSNFPRVVLYCQFNRIWNKKSISLFFLSFSSYLDFLKFSTWKTIIKKCLKQIVG